MLGAELQRQGGRIDPKILMVLVVVGLLFGATAIAMDLEAPQPGTGVFQIYSVAESPYLAAAQNEPTFTVTILSGNTPPRQYDLLLRETDVAMPDNSRGHAAFDVLSKAITAWQNEQLSFEEDQAAAFPVAVTVVFQTREVITQAPAPPGNNPGIAGPPVLNQTAAGAQVNQDLSPTQVEPPFPIRSLLLTFAYVVPASLLAQVHASNMHAERTRHRGVLLLSAPVSAVQILLAKSAPGLIGALALAAGITLYLGAGLFGFLAAICFLGFLFALTSLLALISRSPRELSLLQVASTTLLNVFLFLPAMFPSIPPVAFLSPVHVVAAGIRGDPVTWGQFLYATMPLSLAALALGALAVGILRDEILFSVESAPRRILGAIDVLTRSWWRLLLAGTLVVPFVFAAQILVLVMASVIGLRGAFLVWLPISVLLEEAAKGLPIWARRNRHPWLTGALVGAGFFLAEKGYLVLTLVGFRNLPYSDEALAILGTGPGMALLIIPLFLHIATAIILAVLAHRGRAKLGFAIAAIVHLGYDQLLLGIA